MVKPMTLDDIVGQQHVVKSLKAIVQNYKLTKEKIPHFLFVGKQGTGKTSTAHSFANDLGLALIEMNASDSRKIDDVRTKIKPITQTKGDKLLLLDEFDAMTDDSQDAMKRIIELSSCPIILTANSIHKIIEPIQSRCVIYYFNPLTDQEMVEVLRRMFKSLNITLNQEDAKEILIALINEARGDARKIFNLIKQIKDEGKELTLSTVLLYMPKDRTNEILEKVLEGDFKTSLEMLEDQYIKNDLDNEVTIEQLYKTIRDLDAEWIIKHQLFKQIAEVERNIKIGCNPLIQLTSVLSLAYSVRQSIRATPQVGSG